MVSGFSRSDEILELFYDVVNVGENNQETTK